MSNSIKELEGTQSSDPNQGKSSAGIMLSWSTTGLRRDGTILLLCRLSDASDLHIQLKKIFKNNQTTVMN